MGITRTRNLVLTAEIADGALSADADGRAKMANGYFTNAVVAKFADSLFAANDPSRAKFADGIWNNAKVAADAAIALTKMATNLTNVVLGLGAGYKVARGSAEVPDTGSVDVVTGLTTIVAACAIPRADLAATAMWVSCTWANGTLTLKTWKPTAADGAGANVTPIAGSSAHQVDWIAIGT